MSESPVGPSNDMQRDLERASKTCAAFTISSVASVNYNNSAGDVPLENAPNVGCSGSEQRER